MRTNAIAAVVSLLLAAAVLGCQNAPPTSPGPTQASLNFVSVTGSTPSIGGSTQFAAIAVYSDGSTVDVTTQAAWLSTNPAVMTVGAGGVVTGVSAGTAEIRATFQSTTGAMSVTVSAVPCVFTVQPAQVVLPVTGGSAVITVVMTQGTACAWTAQANQAFLTVSGATGTGSGSVSVSAGPNAGLGRSGSLTVAGATVIVNQGQTDCVASVSPVAQSFSAAGGTGSVTVTAPAGCTWAAENGGFFITLIQPHAGSGNGSFSYRIPPNTSGAPRQGPINVERLQTVVTQDVPSGTFLIFHSDAGDYVGRGQSYVAVAPFGTFTPYMSAANHVQVNVQSSDGLSTHNWTVNFQAPIGQPLVPGAYENATRWPFQAAGVPGLSFFGDGRACNESTGRFVVLDAVYGPGPSLIRFWATFEHHCEGPGPALRGEISFGR